MELFDLVESSDAEVTELFSAFDAIVHCGYLPPVGERQLCLGAPQRRHDAAGLPARAGGRRAARGGRQHQPGRQVVRAALLRRPARPRGPEDYPRPDNFYGWAKAAYETLGFLYACGSLGRKLEVVQLRIVAPREIDAAAFAATARATTSATSPATSASATCSSCS